jgi:DNA-binding MarR family transcriptional regulator
MPDNREGKEVFITLTHLYQDVSRAFVQRFGMSYSRILILHELMHAGEISQTEIGRRLEMEGALVTRIVKRMEAVGLITRRVDPGDNRFMLVTLAPMGHQVLQEAETLGEEFRTRLLEGVGEQEQVEIIRVMKHIQANLSHWRQ